METWGSRFVRILRTKLNSPYDSAPGYNLDAYSGEKPRDPEYRANRIKSRVGSALYESIEGRITPDGFELLMNDYWEYVNYGRLPGKYVPIGPLYEWAKLKGFPDYKAAAWGANHNIKKFGIAPTYFYENAIETLEVQFLNEAAEWVDKTLNDFFDNLLETNIQTR